MWSGTSVLAAIVRLIWSSASSIGVPCLARAAASWSASRVRSVKRQSHAFASTVKTPRVSFVPFCQYPTTHLPRSGSR